MNDGMQQSWISHGDKPGEVIWNHPVMDIDELIVCIAAAAQDSHNGMGPGLPSCVYQLKLFNDLAKKGLRLKVVASMLNQCAKNEPGRSLIIVNEVLVIEYISAERVSNCNKKRIKFDLQNHNYARGLLINTFSHRNKLEFLGVLQNDMVH